VARTLSEHAALRGLIADNQTGSLAQFADLPTAHIRFEEKELFQRAQQLLDLGQLAELMPEY
jgi:hemerythrin-like domain-containing protein